MSDDNDKGQDKPKGGVRRVGKDSQKNELKAREMSFPPDELASEETAAHVPLSDPASAPAEQPPKPPVLPEQPTPSSPTGGSVAKPSTKSPVMGEKSPAPAKKTPVKQEQPPKSPKKAAAAPVPPQDMPYVPPIAKPAKKTKTSELPRIIDDEEHIPTSRGKVFTPPAERYPPVAIPRELPPEIEHSPNLYPPPPKRTLEIAASPRQKRMNMLANVFIGLIGTLIVAFIGYALYIWQNPYSALNPLAPPTPLPVIITATFPPLPADALNPQSTVTVSASGQVTPTLPNGAAIIDNTLTTPTPLGGGTSSSVATSNSGDYPFNVSEPGILYTPNGNGRECEWSSIAGTVVNINGEPYNGLGVHIVDQTNGEANTVFSGSSLTFGDGGFELSLGSVPQQNAYTVQLMSPAGLPLSDELMVITSQRCNQNVVLVNFEQVKPF
jgi:hypothetical protein